MTYLLFGVAIVAWCAIGVCAMEYGLGRYGALSLMPFAVYTALTFAIAAYIHDKENSEAPCVKYEQRMMYNAATKTMMPARVYVERGEWVK